MKILVALALALLIIGGGYYLFSTTVPAQSEGESATSTPTTISVATKTIHEESTAFLIDAEYPQFGIPVIDAQIEKTVRDSIEGFKKDTQETPPSPVPAKYELTTVFDPPYVGDDVVSVRLIVSTYTGGAHPLAYLNGLNFDRASGRMLTVSDALRMADLPLSDVAAESLKQMRQKHGGALFEEGLVATPENYSTFVVDGTKITFVFQLYQVAAYAEGFQEVSFPRKK